MSPVFGAFSEVATAARLKRGSMSIWTPRLTAGYSQPILPSGTAHCMTNRIRRFKRPLPCAWLPSIGWRGAC